MDYESYLLSPARLGVLLGRDDPFIVEVGANDGTDTLELLETFPRASIHCFEPDPRPLGRFLKQVDSPRVHLHTLAVSAADGWAEFHLSNGVHPDFGIADWDFSSSLRSPKNHLSRFPWCTFERKITVATARLDTWLTRHSEIATIDFLRVDIQGAEGDLVRGGREALARTRYFYTEFSNYEEYAGQPSLDELVQMLPEFEVLGIVDGFNVLLRNRALT